MIDVEGLRTAITAAIDALADVEGQLPEPAPVLPPARLLAVDKAVPFNTRMRLSSIAAIEARARQDGISLKLVLCRALEAYGIEMAAADLEDGTPRRRAAA